MYIVEYLCSNEYTGERFKKPNTSDHIFLFDNRIVNVWSRVATKPLIVRQVGIFQRKKSNYLVRSACLQQTMTHSKVPYYK